MARKQATKRATKKRKSHCEICHGTGMRVCIWCQGTGREACEVCDGEGILSCDVCHGTGEWHVDGTWLIDDSSLVCQHCWGEKSVKCWSCFGSGQEPCRFCGGTGEEPCKECSSVEEVDAFFADYEDRKKERSNRCPPERWRKERDEAEEKRKQVVKRYQEEKHAKMKEDVTVGFICFPVKITVFVVLLVMGFKDLGDSVGDTVIGVLWIWAAIAFFRKAILKE